MRSILVATESSAAGSYAVDIAAELAKAFDGKLLILTVADNLTGGNIRELFGSHRDFGEALESHSTQIRAEAEKNAQRLGVTNIQLQIGWGDPARSIMEIAGRQAIDVIVIGRRGRGELAGLPLGTVAQKVVSPAPCSVIVVPEFAERSPDDAPWS